MFNLTFLNAIFLAGMAAGVVPIIIHLLQRRRLRRIEFSDLRFVAPLNRQRMRSLTLRRLLLLVLRVFIIVFTALAMARPSVRGTFSNLLPTQARSSVLLLVDTSYSMRTEGEHGTAMDVAKAMGGRLLDVLERGDQVDLMSFDEAPRALFQTPVHDAGLVRQRLLELQAGHGSTNWTQGIEAGLKRLALATEPNRELYVLSDFAGARLDSTSADLAVEQHDARVVFVPARVEPFVNVSIEGVQVPPGAVLRDEPVHLAVTVRNHAQDVPADCNLQVELNGEPKGEANLRLGAGAVQTHEFTVVATQANELAGVVRKRVDRLPEDDVRYFVLPVLAQLRVLLVAGSGDAGGSFFVSRALAPAPGGRTPLALSEVPAARLSSGDLEGVQVVVVASDAHLGDVQAQIVAEFVRDGGGLCLLSGQRDTADPVNRQLLTPLGGARVRGVVQQKEQGYINLADLRPSGILAGFKEDELRTLEAVKFRRYAELVAAGDTRTVLHFAGGQPALVEGTSGSGKYMLFAFDAGTDASDLALSPMFLPLLHRAVVYLAGETGRQKLAYRVGEPIEVQVPIPAVRQAAAAAETRLAQAGIAAGGVRPAAPSANPAAAPAGGDARAFTVTTPAGQKEALVARYVGKMAVVDYEQTSEPGDYIFEGGGRRLVRAVNVDTRESDLRRIDLGELQRKLGLKDVDKVENAESIAQQIREARHGKELYKLIVVLVLGLMTAELLLSRASRDSVS